MGDGTDSSRVSWETKRQRWGIIREERFVLTSSQHNCSMISLHSSHFSRTCLSLVEACSRTFKYLECFAIRSELASWDGDRFSSCSSRKSSSSPASSSRIAIAYNRVRHFIQLTVCVTAPLPGCENSGKIIPQLSPRTFRLAQACRVLESPSP